MDILVLHDGELGDVCGLLGSLGQPYTERRGALTLSDTGRHWDLLIATPARVLRCDPLLARPETRSIVVTDARSRTVERRLSRLGVDLLVRRPVHPATLEGVLLHALYQGPERRRHARAPIGLPIRVRVGWLLRRAVLSDLSVRGARLLMRVRPPLGRRLVVRLPAASTAALSLPGEVVRVQGVGAGKGFEVGVAFTGLERAALPVLRERVAAHAQGPAVWPHRLPRHDAATRDRRTQERRPYERHVITLGEAGARVVLGRDLSRGGMRIDGRAGLEAGQRLRVALHVKPGEVPLVVEADVIRDDGEGLALRFVGVGDSEAEQLGKMVDQLPVGVPRGPGWAPRVLTELIF